MFQYPQRTSYQTPSIRIGLTFCHSVPAGVVAGIVVLFSIPNRFPHHAKPEEFSKRFGHPFSSQNLRRIDVPGAILLLIATLFLVAALEEAGVEYPWRSAFVITLLTISGLAWIAFVLWERMITLHTRHTEPVFPWRFFQNRAWIGMIL